ncbi:hypothetical protein COW80_01165 [Candidatus Beckwithbacteria bacterium CG22_combo_CG10-13_8_21_14_all_01_47_9]|uniref:Transcriptional regulator, AbiEi antitoxin, Type IV TA system n=3 Tax=Microgenomates group TaxID=1794810 RepID=A0A2H0E1H5_9BACT|nr:MAG: hypothetical protein COX09_02560 [Candidatus Beckwithbacteria bacterium CG23_combo_of_CG06-09_8_20_14_all_47_9]PIP88284.1 MAG: hypothetical protein COW80_01165 [Candidatus Beckwithbacteria bacterium CG22_combo_CG10-13_8_21_14_all_01_47_9]PIU74413.1 MAG: hypothetical protein COS77_01645 [Candidatus Roizmanbacteria bacterium CG06_land_8_20_14_3_00_34_14]
MNRKNLNFLSPLDFFTKETLRQMEPDEDALDFNIKSWIKSGKIISLKKGMYLLRERWEKQTNKQGFLEYLANKIYQPSYLSGEYVMAKYGLLTEAVYGLSSVTTAKTKAWRNQLGVFSYYSIAPELYRDYEVIKFYSAPVLIASKPKAIFDFLYFRFLRNSPVNILEARELRINWEGVSKKELVKIEEYAGISKSEKTRQLIKLIKSEYYA